MYKNLLFCLLLLVSCSLFAFQSTENPIIKDSNKVKRYFYKDKIVAKEKWYGNDKKIDSLKTYYKTGELDECFYYSNSRYHGTSFKFNKEGEKITTWIFENGKLLNREDHILVYNNKNEEKIKAIHVKLKKINKAIIENPKKLIYRRQLAQYRQQLGNYTLAFNGLNKLQSYLLKSAKKKKSPPPGKIMGSIYDAKATLYSYYEMENYATQYKYKAVKSDPENNRLVFNLGAYLYTIKSYDLSKYYLNKSLKKSPKHAFTHRVLAALYSDFEDYEKAKYHINIAFPNEKNLIKHGFGNLQNDIRTLRGFISHNLNDSESGISDLKEAIALNKNNSFAYRNLGVVYHDLGEYDLACKYLQKAKTLGYEKIHDRYDLQEYLEFSCKQVIAEENKMAPEIKPVKLPKLSNKPFVYPNPTKGDLSVKNIDFSDFNYLVFDHTGKLITQGISNEKSINISELPSGVYIVKITNKNTTETFRVVKE